jgi:hypothetical protein
MREGPWSYRISSVLLVTPVYSVILLTIGTILGKHHFFANVVRRMWSRIIPALRRPSA